MFGLIMATLDDLDDPFTRTASQVRSQYGILTVPTFGSNSSDAQLMRYKVMGLSGPDFLNVMDRTETPLVPSDRSVQHARITLTGEGNLTRGKLNLPVGIGILVRRVDGSRRHDRSQSRGSARSQGEEADEEEEEEVEYECLGTLELANFDRLLGGLLTATSTRDPRPRRDASSRGPDALKLCPGTALHQLPPGDQWLLARSRDSSPSPPCFLPGLRCFVHEQGTALH